MIELRIEGHEVNEIAAAVQRSKRSVERVLQDFRQRLDVIDRRGPMTWASLGGRRVAGRRRGRRGVRGGPGPRRPAELADFAPPPDHPERLAILCELVRVDLEHRWQGGQPRRAGGLPRLFPELFEDPELVHAMAFEEYRLRLQAGEQPAPAEYRRRFGVEGVDWPMPAETPAPRAAGRKPRRSSDHPTIEAMGWSGPPVPIGITDARGRDSRTTSSCRSARSGSLAGRPSSSGRWTAPTRTRPSGWPRPWPAFPGSAPTSSASASAASWAEGRSAGSTSPGRATWPTGWWR